VITYVAAENVVALVYVAGFAPEPGESAFTLAGRFPGSTLADALEPVTRADGTTDLTIATDRFRGQFAADVPAAEAARMAATQRPVAREALLDAGGGDPLWKRLPSWFIYGERDRNIPAALQGHMAVRAVAERAVEIPGASHAVAVSCPDAVAGVILQAATEPAVA
jgi:pimeloyl-ACP methyl ester carboxylesterase